jgi:tetratricopeptide (TPR) repeat protein
VEVLRLSIVENQYICKTAWTHELCGESLYIQMEMNTAFRNHYKLCDFQTFIEVSTKMYNTYSYWYPTWATGVAYAIGRANQHLKQNETAMEWFNKIQYWNIESPLGQELAHVEYLSGKAWSEWNLKMYDESLRHLDALDELLPETVDAARSFLRNGEYAFDAKPEMFGIGLSGHIVDDKTQVHC